MADINKLKVAELKEELKKRGLGTTGLKKDLVERLEAAIASESVSAPVASEPAPAATSEPAPAPPAPAAGTAPASEPVSAPERATEAKEVEAAPMEAEAPASAPEAEPKPAEPSPPAPVAEPTPVTAPSAERPKAAAPAPEAASPASVEMDVEEEPAPVSRTEAPKPPVSSNTVADTSVPPSALDLPTDSMEVYPSALTSSADPSGDPSGGARPSSTLYITGLRRPLQARSLASYLNSFTAASADDEYDPPSIPGSSPFVSPSVPNLWLSGIKDHAYFRTWSISAASAIKAGADGHKWPKEEPNAGTLHVRYVPDSQVKELVEEEEAGWRNGRQRFELVDDTDGGEGGGGGKGGEGKGKVRLEAVGKQTTGPPPPAPAGAAARGLLGRMGDRVGGPGGLGRQAPRGGVNALPIRGRAGGPMRYTRARPSLAWTPGPRAPRA